MEEKIQSYRSEIEKIQTVLEKLVTKQNASVCDKLCIMCNSLFERVVDYQKEELTEDTKKGLIDVLKDLRSICIQLKNYQDYLIVTITENIEALNGQEENPSTSLQGGKQLQYVNTAVSSSANIQPIMENQEKNAA